MAGNSRAERQERLVSKLSRSQDPLPARQLGELLGIAPRTVRDYVADLNSGLKHPLIVSDQRGYRLDRRMYNWYRSQKVEAPDEATPRGRMAALIRYLVHDEEVDIHLAAQHFYVSVPTIESDLVRVRAVVRDQQLVLRRDGDSLFLEGSERAKRRLLRSVLFSADGGSPMDALLSARDKPNSLIAQISGALTNALAANDLELNEFVRGELLIHLVIAVERARADKTWATPLRRLEEDDSLAVATNAIIAEVEKVSEVPLGEGEARGLFALLLANSARHSSDGGLQPQPEMMELASDTLLALTEQFGVRREDDHHLAPLALHLQHLKERAFLGRQLESPMGSTFKRTHPLLHEMALLFAHALGVRTGLEIGQGEVDYLALHLGAHFQSQLEAGPLVSVTLIAPQHGSLTALLSEKVLAAITGLATIQGVVTNLSADTSGITSDLVITTVPPPAGLAIPYVQISPFGSDTDTDAIRDALHRERERQRRERLRSNLISLLEPDLFAAVDTFEDRDAAVAYGAALLQLHGLVEEGFAQDVLERDRRSSTTFGTGFAIPHSLYQDALRTGIAVLRVAQPFPWAGQPVSIVFMCAIAPEGMSAFRDALEILVEILSPPQNIAKLAAQSSTFADFTKSLLSFLD